MIIEGGDASNAFVVGSECVWKCADIFSGPSGSVTAVAKERLLCNAGVTFLEMVSEEEICVDAEELSRARPDNRDVWTRLVCDLHSDERGVVDLAVQCS